MISKKTKMVDVFPDFENEQVVGIDNFGREIWYANMDMNKAAWRTFDKKGRVVYYKNTDGEEITRKFDRKGNLVYSSDCGDIVVDKRMTGPLRKKLNEIKLKFKYREPLKLKIKYLIFRIKHRKEIKEALKKVEE